jgi:hypothetical protein
MRSSRTAAASTSAAQAPGEDIFISALNALCTALGSGPGSPFIRKWSHYFYKHSLINLSSSTCSGVHCATLLKLGSICVLRTSSFEDSRSVGNVVRTHGQTCQMSERLRLLDRQFGAAFLSVRLVKGAFAIRACCSIYFVSVYE